MEKTFIIAEAGVNHNGSLDIATKMVEKAMEAGADAVKFQTWKTENVVTPLARKAEYQKTGEDDAELQFEMLKKLELDYEDFWALKKHADNKGIIFLSTADDEESADFLEDIVPLFKVGSGEVTNLPFLRHVAEKGKPLILSTGMSDLDEVEKAVRTIREVQSQKTVGDLDLMEFVIPPLILLHCVSCYPSPAEDSNLRVMKTLSTAFDLPVGYSDHTEGIVVSIAAVALGATVIEKHFTLDRGMTGPDHSSSLEPEELKAMVEAIREVERALGDGVKRLMPSESGNLDVVRKSLVAARDILKGTVVTPDMLTAKRPGSGIAPEKKESFVGKEVKRDIERDELIEEEMFC
jgi:N-acetylneuraminate synthase